MTTCGTPTRGEEERIGQVLRAPRQGAGGGRRDPVPARSARWPSCRHAHRGHAHEPREAAHDAGTSTSPPRRCRSRSSRRPRRTSTRWARRSARLLEEDPTIKVERQTETGEQLLWGQGENQIAGRRSSGSSASSAPRSSRTRRASRTARRSAARPRSRAGTRSRRAAAASSATCGWRSSPTRAAASSSHEHVVGGVVPRQFFPGVEKGVRDVREKGPSRATRSSTSRRRCTTARSTRSTRTSSPSGLPAQLATRKGIQDASPVLLEPIMDVEVRVPEEYMGDVNRDLNTRRGRVLGMDSGRRHCRSCTRTCRSPSCSPTRPSSAR